MLTARRLPAAFLLLSVLAAPAAAQIVVSANDGKAKLVDGVNTTVPGAIDTVTILDVTDTTPRLVGQVRAPTSVIGPPQSVAIAPDESIALVTASTRLDPKDSSKTAHDNKLTVIDLRSSPPAIITTLEAGTGASGVSINRAGTLAIVANRFEGTLSVFTIRGTTVTAAGKVDLQAPDSQPSGVAFARDGRTALVTRNNDSLISILDIDGDKVSYARRDIAANLKPYGIEVTAGGEAAIVAGIGVGASGGSDVVSVIDLKATPPRAVDHLAVGPTAEGIAVSPDGRHIAVTIINGTNNPTSSPLFKDAGLVRVLRLDGGKLSHVAEAATGRWCQGTTFIRQGKAVLVQCMVEAEIQVFDFDGTRLARAPSIKVGISPAGIRTAQR